VRKNFTAFDKYNAIGGMLLKEQLEEQRSGYTAH
jgi:hypothetical protein